MNQLGPLIVQSDHTLMLEVEHPQYADCRDFLVLFAELVKSPEVYPYLSDHAAVVVECGGVGYSAERN